MHAAFVYRPCILNKLTLTCLKPVLTYVESLEIQESVESIVPPGPQDAIVTNEGLVRDSLLKMK